MWLKNEGDTAVEAKFNGTVLVFDPGQVINIAASFPESLAGQAAAHFCAKYGLKAVQEPIVPAIPKIPAAEPEIEQQEEPKQAKKKDTGKKRG